MTYAARAFNPKLSQDALSLLQQQLLAPAQTAARQQLVLRALANTGHPDLVEMLTPYLKAQQPDVRAQAVRALRRVETPEADIVLRRIATTDTAEPVQYALKLIERQRDQRAHGRIR